MDPDETARMRRLNWIHAGRKRTMLVFTWRGSFALLQQVYGMTSTVFSALVLCQILCLFSTTEAFVINQPNSQKATHATNTATWYPNSQQTQMQYITPRMHQPIYQTHGYPVLYAEPNPDKDQPNSQAVHATNTATWYPNSQQTPQMQYITPRMNQPLYQTHGYPVLYAEPNPDKGRSDRLVDSSTDRALAILAGVVNLFSPLKTSNIAGLIGILRYL